MGEERRTNSGGDDWRVQPKDGGYASGVSSSSPACRYISKWNWGVRCCSVYGFWQDRIHTFQKILLGTIHFINKKLAFSTLIIGSKQYFEELSVFNRIMTVAGKRHSSVRYSHVSWPMIYYYSRGIVFRHLYVWGFYSLADRKSISSCFLSRSFILSSTQPQAIKSSRHK